MVRYPLIKNCKASHLMHTKCLIIYYRVKEII